MPIYANKDAQEFWNRSKTHSRSLAATRFANLKTQANGAEDQSYRSKHATQVKNGSINNELIESRATFTALLDSQGASTVYARLEARLILNAGDGVIENGGICLDRNSGVPFIPGSAIKGCARRHAISKLSHTETTEETSKTLAEICLIFGYGDTEWKAGRDTKKEHSHSDFWLAMVPLEEPGKELDAKRDERWSKISEKARQLIFEALMVEKFPKQLSGCIAFLPSYPERDPGIDLDIITCHHPKYYKGERAVATDDEDPNPVPFPTIAKGGSFRFSLLPCQPFCHMELLNTASKHLSEGLQIFGLGAKTNAGYGWFSIDEAAARRDAEKREKQAEEAEKQARRESMSEEELIADDFQELEQAEFARVIGNLDNEPPEKQKVACQMLAGSEKEQWKKWKRQKKGKWPARVPQIRKIAKSHNIELS